MPGNTPAERSRYLKILRENTIGTKIQRLCLKKPESIVIGSPMIGKKERNKTGIPRLSIREAQRA